jgi:omega-6 fatty acid desaturase (delta-12 desaturase)
MFLLQHRLPIGAMREGWGWWSVLGANLGLALLAAVLTRIVGLRTLLIAHLPVVVLAGMIGIALFYVQHQFEDSRWMRHTAWSPTAAALAGSSHLVLPRPFRWLTANIGLHHVHHASSRIPFYWLPAARNAHPALASVPRLRAGQVVSAFQLALWDETAGRLVTFREAEWSLTGAEE